MSAQPALSSIITRFTNSGLALIFLIISSVILYVILKRNIRSARQQNKLKSRIIYITALIYALVLVRIWIEGFSHLFTMLSLVAAGLVVANKESLMNLTGWFIINWRGLFSIGDSIQITNLTGYVCSAKLLYFKIYETTALGAPQPTGKIIKIPNSLIINNPIYLFTSDDFFMLHRATHAVKITKQLAKHVKQLSDEIEKITSKLYADNPFIQGNTEEQKKSLSSMINPKPSILILPIDGKLDIVTLEVNFYCQPQDFPSLHQTILLKLIALNTTP